MKILVISHMYPSAQNPVYGIFVHKQVKALMEQGNEIKVISPVPYAPWPLNVLKKKWRAYTAVPLRDRIEGVEAFYPRYPEFPRSFLLEHSGYFMFLGMKTLVKHIRREYKFDLIHAHVALPDGSAALFFKEKYKVPTVVTVHGQDFQSTINKRKSCRQKVFQVMQNTDRIITVSSKLRNLVKDQAFAGKIAIINNGIDLEDCQVAGGSEAEAKAKAKAEAKANNAPAGKIKIVSVSNLKKTKGINLNLRALVRLLKDYPLITYIIVGEGEERRNLESLADQLKLRDHVVFRGKLSHPEAMREIASADIFCLPSWEEGFGAVYIEAMAQGVPTIGVKGEGIEDVIIHGRNGLLVRPQNVDDIAEALALLLSNPSLAATLAEEGRNTVIEGFTWEHNASRTTDVYKELLTKIN